MIEMRQGIGAALAACVLLLACSSNSTEPDGLERFEGFYAHGFEVESFQACDSAEDWWVVDGAGLQEEHRQLGAEQYAPIWAVVRGRLSEPGSYGHLGAYDRELSVEEVLAVAPASGARCD